MEHQTVEDAALDGRAALRPVTRGPRGARGEIRQRITEAALRSFADHGLDGASTRAIARDADCDPALVRYYFSSKQQLFDHVVRRPAALDAQLDAMAALPHGQRAAYLAALVETCWDDPETSAFWRSLLRTAATDPAVARMLEDTWSDFVALGVVRELAAVVGGPVVGEVGAEVADGQVALADRRPSDRPLGVVALASITGMLAAVHVSSSRRAGALTAHDRSQGLADVLRTCFTAPPDA